MRYKNWTDLFVNWARGVKDIFPSRSRWQYRVEDDILIHRSNLTGGGFRDTGVGWPIGTPPSRMFAYLTNQWRLRMQDRAELEDMGGVPILDAEMNYLLRQANRQDLIAWADDPSDLGALQFLHAWVRGRGQATAGVNWRGGRLEPSGGALYLAWKPRGRALRSARLASFDPPGGDCLEVVAQVCRSPLQNWIKDALYCVVSRGNPGVQFRRLGAAGCGQSRTSGGYIQIKQVPTFILDLWPFKICGTPTFPI